MENIAEHFNDITKAIISALPGAGAVIVGTIIVLFLVNRGFGLLATKRKISESDVALTRKVINWMIIAVAFLSLIGVFGFDIGGLWTMLSTVLAMVAIGFVAVWSVLSNVSCTAMIILFRPFGVGDLLEFVGDEGVKGRVVDLNFLYTTLETGDGAVLQIPNSLFFQKVLKRTRGTEQISLAEQLMKEDRAA
jgi:small-conductance mechanosensitive channel